GRALTRGSRKSLSHHDYGLAGPPDCTLAAFERLASLRQREGRGDFDVQLITVDESSKFPQLLSIRCHDEKYCADPIFVGLVGRRRFGQGDQPSAAAKHRERTVQRVAADG